MLWCEKRTQRMRRHDVLVTLCALVLLSACLSVVEIGTQIAIPAQAGASTVTTTTSSWSDSLSCTDWRSVQVPVGVTSASYKVWGGGGAAGDNYSYGVGNASGGNGGRGALVQGAITGLSSGSFLSAKIGCGGSDGSGSSPGYIPGAGALNNTGGGGGAASALCHSVTIESCTTVLAIASGGGGGGRGNTNLAGTVRDGGKGGDGFASNGTARNQGNTGNGGDGDDGGNCCSGTMGSGGNGSSQNGPPDTSTAPGASPTFGSGTVPGNRSWNSAGGGGGGLIGGAGGQGGANGVIEGYGGAGGGGAGTSWYRTSGTINAASSSFGNAGGITYCSGKPVGTNPGYGGNSQTVGCSGYVEITWNVNTTSTTFVTQPSSSAIAGEKFATQPVVAAVDSSKPTLSNVEITLTYTGTSSGTLICSSNPVKTDSSGYAAFDGCVFPSPGSYTIKATNGITGAVASSQTITVSENNSWSDYSVDFTSCGTTSYALPSTANLANFIARGAGGGAGGRDTVANNGGAAGGTATLTGANLRDGSGNLRASTVDMRIGCGGGGGESKDPGTAAGGAGGSGWGAGGNGGAAWNNKRVLGGGGGGGGTALCFTSCQSGGGGTPLVVAGGGGGSGGSYNVAGGSGGSPGGSVSSTNNNWYGTASGAGSVANGSGGGTGACGVGGGGGTTAGGAAGSGCGGTAATAGSGSSAVGGKGGAGGAQGSDGTRRTGGGGGGGGYFGGGGGGQDYQNSGSGAGGGGGAGSSWVNTGIGGTPAFQGSGGGGGGSAQNKDVTGGAGGSGSARIELQGTAVMIVPPSNQTTTVGTVNINLPIASTFSTVDGKLSALTWTQTGLPAGMTINSSTGTISGTAPSLAGTYSISVTAKTTSASSGISPANAQLSKSVTFLWNFVPDVPYKLVFTSASVTGPASANATLGPITVQRRDKYGNITSPGSATTVNLSSDSTGTAVFSSTLNGSTVTSLTIPAFASSAIFYYGDTKIGNPKITASGLTVDGTQTELITPAADNKLVITQAPMNPSPVREDLGLQVEVRDQFGNRTLSTASITVTISQGSGTLSGLTTVAAVAGNATFTDLQFDQTGLGYKLKFTSGSLTFAETLSFDVAVFAKSGMVLKYLESDPTLAANNAVPGSGVAAVSYYYCLGFSVGDTCSFIGTSAASGSQFAYTWSGGLPAVNTKIRIVTVPKDRVENSRSTVPADLGSAPSTPVYIVN